MSHWLSRNRCKTESGQRFTVDGNAYVLRGKLGDGAAALVRKTQRLSDGAELAIKFLAPDPKYIDEGVFDDVAARF
jgi:X-X-X-Leu-X-X-Gly heptad repeat protein